MSIRIRPVRPEEYARVGRLTLDAYDAAGTIEGPYRKTITDTEQRVKDGATVLVAVEHTTQHTGEHATVLVAVDGDKVLGSVSYVGEENEHFENAGAGDCGFRMLAVDPAAQGRGVGRALIRRCIQLARQQDRRRLAIYSMEWMPVAHRLYGLLGFTRRPDRDVMFPAGVGYAYQLDLVDDADAHFDPPGPAPDEPPWYEDAWAPPTAGY